MCNRRRAAGATALPFQACVLYKFTVSDSDWCGVMHAHTSPRCNAIKACDHVVTMCASSPGPEHSLALQNKRVSTCGSTSCICAPAQHTRLVNSGQNAVLQPTMHAAPVQPAEPTRARSAAPTPLQNDAVGVYVANLSRLRQPAGATRTSNINLPAWLGTPSCKPGGPQQQCNKLAQTHARLAW